MCNFVYLPKAAGICQNIDPTIKSKITELVVDAGLVASRDVKTMLAHHVRQVEPGVEPTNRRFYPTSKTVVNHIRLAGSTHSPDDQDDLTCTVSSC